MKHFNRTAEQEAESSHMRNMVSTGYMHPTKGYRGFNHKKNAHEFRGRNIWGRLLSRGLAPLPKQVKPKQKVVKRNLLSATIDHILK